MIAYWLNKLADELEVEANVFRNYAALYGNLARADQELLAARVLEAVVRAIRKVVTT